MFSPKKAGGRCQRQHVCEKNVLKEAEKFKYCVKGKRYLIVFLFGTGSEGHPALFTPAEGTHSRRHRFM